MTAEQWNALMKMTEGGKTTHTTPMLVGDVHLSYKNDEGHRYFLLELPTRKSRLDKYDNIGKVDREYLRYMYSEYVEVVEFFNHNFL